MKYNVIKINIESKYYPEKLKRIDNPPKELFCIGNLELMRAKSIAIIGSRDYSNYGKRAAKDFSYNLAKKEIESFNILLLLYLLKYTMYHYFLVNT